MTFGLVHANYSLPDWQAVKMTFFAPCLCHSNISQGKKGPIMGQENTLYHPFAQGPNWYSSFLSVGEDWVPWQSQ